MRLIGSVCLVLVATMLLGGCSQSPQAKEAKYLEKGKKEFQNKRYDVAVIQFKNAAQAQPRDAEPWYQLGLAYVAQNDLPDAYRYFLRATELNPKHTGAQLKVAELLATSSNTQNLEEAQKRSQDVLNLLPDDVDALNVLAITELRLGKPQSAEEHLAQALRKSPSSLRSSVALAQTKLLQKDVAGAEEALKQAVAHAPKSPEACVQLGGFYLALGKMPEAEQQFHQALQIDPKNGQALIALGALQVRLGKADQAEQTYRQVSALPDKQYKAIHALYLFQTGKRDQAVAEFEKLNKDDPENRDLRTNLVRAYLSLNRVGDAEKVLTAALKKNGRDVDALLMRSRIYLASGKSTEAKKDLDTVLRFRNNSAEAHYLLSKVRQAGGETSLRQQELGEALKLDPNYAAARIELSQVLIASSGNQTALQLLDEAPAAQKQTVAVVVARNWALISLGRIAEARKGVDQVLAASKAPEALLQDAILKLNQKDYAGARVSADAVLSQDGQETRALGVLLQSYSAQKQMPAGVQKVKEYAGRQPTSAKVQQFLGELLSINGDRAGARKAFEAAQAADPKLTAPPLSIAQLDLTEGKRDDARKRIAAVIASHPKSFAGRMLWAQLESADGKPAAAVEQYRKAVELDDKNVAALNNLAYTLADGKQPDEALKFAQKAKELAPDSPLVDDTLGWTYYQKGMYPLAVTYLEAASSKEATAIRQYHLAMAYLKSGNPNRGRQVLQAALKSDPKLPEAEAARQMFGNVGK